MMSNIYGYMQQMMGNGLLTGELTSGFILLMILAVAWSFSWKGLLYGGRQKEMSLHGLWNLLS